MRGSGEVPDTCMHYAELQNLLTTRGYGWARDMWTLFHRVFPCYRTYRSPIDAVDADNGHPQYVPCDIWHLHDVAVSNGTVFPSDASIDNATYLALTTAETTASDNDDAEYNGTVFV